MTAPISMTATAIASVLRTLSVETSGLEALAGQVQGDMGPALGQAVARIAQARGRVIVTGIGKSGHVGRKIAATLASTGTPAYFVHPSEASHGDLGMITRDDVVLALSWSGETVELGTVISYARRFAVPIIAMTSRADSALAQASEIVLLLPRTKEACPHGLAPTTSTLMQLALGDGLAIALLESKGFSASDFREFHPGGQLGAGLKHVSDIMHGRDQLPLAGEDSEVGDALVVMTEKSFGCIGVTDIDGRLVGVITDGDLRRHMGPGLVHMRAADIMTRRPKSIPLQTIASAALEMLNAAKITALFVVEDGRPVGLVHIHDLLRLGVI
jgi:arabinose-5-phosphate isomerase